MYKRHPLKALTSFLGLVLILLVPKTSKAQYGGEFGMFDWEVDNGNSLMFDWEADDSYYASDAFTFDGVAGGYEQLMEDLSGLIGWMDGYGGLLRGSSEGYSITTELFGSDGGGYQIGTEQFGYDVPLGSGLFIMTAAGAAYALRKRKKNK